MRVFITLSFLILLSFCELNASSYAHRVSQLANDYSDFLNGSKLYGRTFKDGTTENGVLACARVVQIVLAKAGVPGFRRPIYSVWKMQQKTRGWKTVKYDEIEPGDIVFWRKAGEDSKCEGGGDCHVGIAVGNGQAFDNDGIFRRPFIRGIGWRLRWRFLYAKRMR